MGCFGSREDARRGAYSDDWTGCEYGFKVASIKTAEGFCPLDALVIKFCGGEGKEIKDGIGEFADSKLAEDKAKELGNNMFEAMKALYKGFEKFKDGTKEGEVMGKYTGTEALAQMDACLKAWCEKSGLEHKWPEVAEAKEGEMEMMGMEEMMAEGDMAMEGGEEGDKKEEGMAAKMSLLAADAFGDVGGSTEIPKLCLSLMFLHPVFGDAVKAQIMFHELGGGSGGFGLSMPAIPGVTGGNSTENFGGVAAVVGAYVNAGESADADSFGCALLNADDLEELKDVVENKETKALVFPGVVGAWASEDDALGQCGDANGKTKVLYKFKGKVLKPAGDKLHVFCRQFAKVESLEQPEGKDYHVCTLADFSDHVFETVEAYNKKVAELIAAAGEVKEAVEDKMMEGEKMDDMAMMEGEGMM